MNSTLAKLLFSAPNIVCPNDGLFSIDMEEWMKLLDMDSGIKFPSVGDWVTVCRGLYKGDVGYVLSIENWGQVTLLLISCSPLWKGELVCSPTNPSLGILYRLSCNDKYGAGNRIPFIFHYILL